MSSQHVLESEYNSRSPLRTFVSLLQISHLKHLGIYVLFLLKMLPQLLLPILIAESIRIASEAPPDAWNQLGRAYTVYLLITLSNIPIHLVFAKQTSGLIRNMELQVRSALVRRLQQLSMSFHSDRERGRIQSKLLRDVEQLVQLSELYFNNAINALLGLLFAFGYTLAKDPLIALGFLIATPIAVGLIRAFTGAMGRRNEALRSHFESMSQRVLEMIDMVPVTRAHGLEELEKVKVGERLESVRKKGKRVDMINALFGSCAFVIFMLTTLFVLAGVTWLVVQGQIGLDKIALYSALFQMVVGSVQGLLNMLPLTSKGITAIRSIGEILECPDLEQNEGKTVAREVAGKVHFDKISFTYPGETSPAIKDFSLEVNAGQCVAFVGESGSGKSTLMQLCIGFLRPQCGHILLDGIPMENIDMRTWRRHIAMVPQQTILFSGTLLENITYGLNNYADEQIDQAIEAANLSKLVRSLPQGLDTPVGENALKLSGGQRQRLAIARALVRNPKVIILDEATSALDVISEKEVQEAIENLVRNRTTFIVAHRLSTIRQADLVVVMKNGYAIEQGSQEELIARNGAFTQLKRLQSQ